MTETKTERGFDLIEFTDDYDVGCSLQKSSACDDHIWLGCDDPNPKIFPGDNTGWHDYKLPPNVSCTTRMHLNREQVQALLPYLKRFAKTGELTDKGAKS